MDIFLSTALVVTAVSLLGWLWLILGRGFFWRMDQRLELQASSEDESIKWPRVRVIVPARNEADMLPQTLPGLLAQDYPGPFEIYLVDDQSDDGTAEVARHLALCTGSGDRLTVVEGQGVPSGWTGKVWAMQQGYRAGPECTAEFLLMTDADVAHPPGSLRALVLKAFRQQLDLVSLMVQLPVSNAWGRLLVPAFVFFFAKLYPISWSNDPDKATAAAAGGCLLLRCDALNRAGGFKMVADQLIDDCELARLIKGKQSPGHGRIWLGLSRDVRSLRSYGELGEFWGVVARTAFTQLRYSIMLLLGTVLGMTVLYAVPVLSSVGGLVAGGFEPESELAPWLVGGGLLTWVLMAGSYLPILKWYRTSPLFGLLIPLTAMLYTLMTIDSARRFWTGGGGAWKGRTYGRPTR